MQIFSQGVLSILAGLLLSTESTQPNLVVGDDDRVPMVFAGYPWTSIGKIVTAKGAYCTATLVGEDIVLTNAHCVLDGDGKPEVGSIFHPYLMNGTSEFQSKIRWVDYGEPTSGDDWALARLSSPLGQRFGYLGSEALTVKKLLDPQWKSKMTVAGYSSDFLQGDTAGVHVGCSVVGDAEENGFIHECDTFRGASGSAFFVFFPDGPRVVGLNWGHKKPVQEKINYGVPSSVFDKQIQKYRVSPEGKSPSTWIHLCNRTGHNNLRTALAYHDGKGWKSRGWWTLVTGECREIEVTKQYSGPTYLYGESDGKPLGGKAARFCISDKKFTLTDADKTCEEGRWAWFYGSVEVAFGKLNRYSF